MFECAQFLYDCFYCAHTCKSCQVVQGRGMVSGGVGGTTLLHQGDEETLVSSIPYRRLHALIGHHPNNDELGDTWEKAQSLLTKTEIYTVCVF